MNRNPIAHAAGLLACLALAAGVAGCRIHVDKDANGQEKNVQVDTPFGGVHVNTDQTTAADLGLPAYPGAQMVKDKDDHESADVHMGFGEWEMRVRAVSYETPDDKDKVVAFYKKALGRYGDVITCENNAAVGTPTQTSEGLTCADDRPSSPRECRSRVLQHFERRAAVEGRLGAPPAHHGLRCAGERRDAFRACRARSAGDRHGQAGARATEFGRRR